MILFDMIMTFIEDFVMSYFIADIVSLLKKRSYIICATILTFVETILFNNLLQNNVPLILILILTFSGLIFIQNKEINLYYIVISSIIIGLLLLSNIISFVAVSAIFSIDVIAISNKNITIIVVSILSRFIFIGVCMIFRVIERRLNIQQNFKIKEWWFYAVFCLLIIIIVGTLCEAIFYNTVSLKLIYIITIEFILMSISFIILYFKIKMNYKNNLRLSNELLKTKHAHEIYSKTNKMSYQIAKDKHEIFYLLLKLKNLIKNEEIDEAIEFIDNKLETFNKYDKVLITNNPMLDISINGVINQFKNDGYNIKYVSNIQNHNGILDNKEVIDILIEYIQLFAEYAKECKKMDIFFIQNHSYIILKIIIPNVNHDIHIKSLKEISCIKKKEIITNDKQIELKLLLKD